MSKRDLLPPLRSQEEIDAETSQTPGCWILPAALFGLVFWVALGLMIV